MATYRTCDGIRRRDFVKIGVLGGAGLTLSNYLRMSHGGEVKSGAATAGIFINLGGGPSHMDTFDLKPDAPSEYRGQFNPIKTNVAGIEICEHFPKLATVTDKFAILRGVSHTLAAHELGSEYINTGSRPLPSIEYPGYGAVVTKELGGPTDLPPFVAIPRNNRQGPGFLGVRYAPLNTSDTPRPGRSFEVRGVSLANGLTIAEVEKRQNLLKSLDRTFRKADSDQLIDGLDQFSQQAHQIITSNRARSAFDVSQESPAYAKQFGETTFGMSCLLATRLVEAGVRFVTIDFGGWDTHQDNWTRLKTRQLPPLDDGLSGLFAGLEQKGLLSSTAVMVTGEFGRTPKINTRSAEGGRDHYPRCMFMLMAGGMVRGGQVLGESDEKATAPKNDGFKPDDVAASFYHNLGIDHTKEYQTNTGRPITIVRDGSVIPSLFA